MDIASHMRRGMLSLDPRFAALAVLVTVVVVCKWTYATLSRRDPREPPGPPRRFLTGNIPDMPTVDAPLGYARLAEQYGPVMQFVLPGRKIVVLSTVKATEDLFGKRGSLYADRPAFPMLSLMGWDWAFALQRHGEDWRVRRKLMHRYLNARAIEKYADLQRRNALVFARKLIEQPALFMRHIKWMTAANIMYSAYGIEIALENDPFVKIQADAVDSFTHTSIPGKFAVDSIPILKYVPEWFPGADFKRHAREGRAIAEAMVNIPFEQSKKDLERGVSHPSLVTDALTQDEGREEEVVIKDTAAQMYFAGADTTVSSITAFFLEMVRHPEVQRKAQLEIDRVVGTDRLPTFADRESLPYVEAVIREVFRMYPVASLGIPHAVREDDVYEGMLIRKGTTVIANLWAVLRDPSVYSNPHDFDPERFLRDGKIDESVMDPRPAFFGYGHRTCPGSHLADTSMYMAVVITLACFDLGVAIENGVEVFPSGEFDHGAFSIPLPFKSNIVTRSKNAESLIAMGLETA